MDSRRHIISRVSLIAAMLLASLVSFNPWFSVPLMASPEPPKCNLSPTTSPSAPPTPSDPLVRVVPPGQPAIDAAWPIVDQKTTTITDSAGRKQTITTTVRKNPGTQQKMTPLTDGCSFRFAQTATQTSTIGGVTQYLKNYYDLYWWNWGSSTYNGYHTSQTEEWGTRTDTSFTLGANSTTWFFHGWDCSNFFQQKDASGSFTPAWYNNSETWHYFYDVMNQWPTQTPGAGGFGNMRTQETTPAYQNGQSIGTLDTLIIYLGSF